MTAKSIIVCFLISLSRAAIAQATPEIISSVPIPEELATNPHDWGTGRTVGCGEDDAITVYLQRSNRLVKFGLNGAVLFRIDATHMAGPGQGQVETFSPGPNGDTYVMGTHITLIERKNPDPSKPPRILRRLDDHPTFLRFDANGALIKSASIPRFTVPWIAAFDSGEFLLVDGALENDPIAWIYSADGDPLKQMDLSKTMFVGHNSEGPSDMSVFGARDKVFIFAQWYQPSDKVRAAVAPISRNGELLSTSVVKLPKGYSVTDTRIMGEHLFGSLQIQEDGDPKLGEAYVEVDPESGDVRNYYKEPNHEFPVCDTARGMSFFNKVNQTLDVIQLKAQ